MWDDFIPHFKDFFDSYKFISIDLPGFGESQMPESLNSLTDAAALVAEFVRSLGLINPFGLAIHLVDMSY